MTDHRIALADGWTVWRTVGLRGAGFPAVGVFDLATIAASEAADRMRDTEREVHAARVATARACAHATQFGPREHAKLVGAALRRSRVRAPDPFAEAPPALLVAFADQAAAEQRFAAAQTAYRSTFDDAALETGVRLRAWARAPRFREAVLWQNRAAVHTGFDRLGEPSATPNSNTRKRERLVANYVQRYCVKNDSIGFFGPFAWATFGETTRLAPGRDLLATRTVYFEYWGIARLADQLAEDPLVRLAIPPRRMPTVTVDGTTLHHPVDRTSELPLPFARLLAACDGVRSAREIAEALVADPALELLGVEEVYELLDELVETKLATWRIELPTAGAPDRSLRAILDAVAHEPGHAALAALDAHREAIEAIAREPSTDPVAREAALDRALAALDATFTQLTSTAATHNAGQTYAARTLVYEDCRRDVSVELGPEHLARLAPPLALVLESARWFTHEVATRYRRALTAAYRELAGETSAVDYIRFWTHVEPHFDRTDGATPIVAAVATELQRRWQESLGPLAGNRVNVRAADLRAAARERFAAPHPGWPSARHHAPDIMMIGPLDAAPVFVLGELHVAMNTLFVPPFLAQHPDPDELVEAMARDLPAPRVTSVGRSERVTRADQASIARDAIDLEIGPTRSARPRQDVVAIGELVVEVIADRLCVRTRDGRRVFDVIEFLDHLLVEATLAQFRMLPPLAHAPRITIDDLVVSRERWTFAPAELGFVELGDAAARFAGARAFAHDRGLPRCVFYKVPEEPKPCYLDFASPMYVEIFARIARTASRIHVSEMLPAVEDGWLVDADGQRYASELRIAAVDPEPWRA